jgi:hypothetical protein
VGQVRLGLAQSSERTVFILQSEKELLRAFRPKDQRKLELPPGLSFPLFVRDSFSWVDSAGARTFVVFQDDATKRPLGIAFRRDGSGGVGSQMCDWCHSMGSDVALLTAAQNSKKRVGAWLCRDLNCPGKLDEQADLAGRSSVGPRRRMVERMQRFAREALRIQGVPAP